MEDSVRSILKSHNVLNVFQNYDFQVGQTMHKAVNGDLPNSLGNRLTTGNAFFYNKNVRIKQTEKNYFFYGTESMA